MIIPPNPHPEQVERDPMLAMLASLAAAISLLERGGKKAAPSDRMFEQMLADYRRALENGRKALANRPADDGEPVAWLHKRRTKDSEIEKLITPDNNNPWGAPDKQCPASSKPLYTLPPQRQDRPARSAFLDAASGYGRAGTAHLIDGPYMSMVDAADVHAQLAADTFSLPEFKRLWRNAIELGALFERWGIYSDEKMAERRERAGEGEA